MKKNWGQVLFVDFLSSQALDICRNWDHWVIGSMTDGIAPSAGAMAYTLSKRLKYSSRLIPAERKLFFIMKTGTSGQSGIIIGLMMPFLV
jgi:tetrahydromethanopterin S-methyltransferase subunit F